MRVVHVSTTVSEASANTRLHRALMQEGIDSRIMVIAYKGDVPRVDTASLNVLDKCCIKIRKSFNSMFHLNELVLPKHPFSFGTIGWHLYRNSILKSADIIHLHWICNIMSINDIQKILAMGKPVVWTCHDSWAFTGGCHVRYGCNHFENACGMCRMLEKPSNKDVSYRVLREKRKRWKGNKITFVAPSTWMGECISESALFCRNRVEIIPNTIDLAVYHPMTDAEIEALTGEKKRKDKINLLFGANDIKTPYKGFEYLVEMLNKLVMLHPDYKDKFVLHIVGAGSAVEGIPEALESVYWGYISDTKKMAAIYSQSDVLLYPSVDDNLPGMIMESLACATPVVAFNTGGISDMVQHHYNGYIAEQKNVDDFLQGLLWVLNHNENNILGEHGVQKVRTEYGYQAIAEKHIELYRSLLNGEKNV